MAAHASSSDLNSSNLLQIWHQLYFDEGKGDARQKADCLRGYMHQIRLAESTGSLSSTACVQLLDTYGFKYQQLMDSPDAASNYEEEALEAVKLKKSEKDLWKSELTPESVLKLDFVQRFIEENRENEMKAQTRGQKLDDEFLNSLISGSKCPEAGVQLATEFQSKILPNSKRRLTVLEDDNKKTKRSPVTFHTAMEQLRIDVAKSGCGNSSEGSIPNGTSNKRSLGGIAIRKSNVKSKFVAPVINRNDVNGCERIESQFDSSVAMLDVEDDRLKNIDTKMVDMIKNEIMDNKNPMTWDDIAGLDFAKKMVKEMVVLPMIRPDFCTRLRRPPKGLLLFGPPGTGKTLIGKVIASNSKSTFFSISASSLTSKWIGEGEKMVRALFAVAKCHQPAVIFIDEIDSLLNQRNDSEHEASRRMKTEFLVQLDGTATQEDDRILVVGATNRPQELDEAARRRLAKKLYIPLPDLSARKQIINALMKGEKYSLSEDEISDIGLRTNGFSGADMAHCCKEAAYGPIRGLSFHELESMPAENLRPIVHQDFLNALSQVKASVSEDDLKAYEDWNNKFGSTSHQII